MLRDPAEHLHRYATTEPDGSLCETGGMWKRYCLVVLTRSFWVRMLDVAPELQSDGKRTVPAWE